MISDATALETIKNEWAGVRKLRDRVQCLLMGSFAQGARAVVRLADIPHNLPFLHACGVFNDTLLQLRDEGHFGCKQRTLGALMNDAHAALRWVDYALLTELVRKRNAVAHDAVILARGDCWRYIDALEAQLIAWNVLPCGTDANG